MLVLRLVLSTVLVVAVAALPPCDDARRLSGSPCDPQINPLPPTALPTQLPTQTILVPMTSASPPLAPRLHVEPVCFADKSFEPLPGAFKPWVAYKYLKANGPFVTTVSKDLMGGQTLKVQNAGKPIEVVNFNCVHEDNEWKARVKDTALLQDILTVRLHDGWCDAWPAKDGPKPPHCLIPVEKCLLQDISLYRSMDDMLGLRLDYGHCPISAVPGTRLPGEKQATIMVGLKRVPDTGTLSTPNVRGFFEDVCHTTNPAATPASTSLDLNKAKEPNAQENCFAASADSEDVSSLNEFATLPCFNDFRVYTLLDVNNRFPVLPVMDSDYAWLLSKLPVGRNPQDSPCAKVNQAKAMFGAVKMDRVCVHFEGMQERTCNNTCGKTCLPSKPFTATTTGGPTIPPPLCIDCEAYEIIYALIATFLVVMLSYYTYLSNTMSFVAVWFFVPLPENPHQSFNNLGPQNVPHHTKLNKHLHMPAFMGMFFIAGVWSFIIYYCINFFDTLLCWLIGMEQCIRVLPFQYWFDEAHYMAVNGTFAQNQLSHLTVDEAGRWIWPHVGPRRIINNDWCPGRLIGMIVATWLSTWFLLCWWRAEQKVAIMKTTIKQEVIVEEQGLGGGMAAVGGSAAGAGGMLTKTLAFFGGSYVPQQ